MKKVVNISGVKEDQVGMLLYNLEMTFFSSLKVKVQKADSPTAVKIVSSKQLKHKKTKRSNIGAH